MSLFFPVCPSHKQTKLSLSGSLFRLFAGTCSPNKAISGDNFVLSKRYMELILRNANVGYISLLMDN